MHHLMLLPPPKLRMLVMNKGIVEFDIPSSKKTIFQLAIHVLNISYLLYLGRISFNELFHNLESKILTLRSNSIFFKLIAFNYLDSTIS